MSRHDVPVIGTKLWYTGDIMLRADLDLLLKDRAGKWPLETFRVDSGADGTTMPAYDAKRLGLDMPQFASQGVSHRQTGIVEVRSGFLRFRVAGMDQTEYAVICFFLGDPATPPDPNQPVTFPRNLLQPFHLLNQLRFTFDRDASVTAPQGTVTIEKKVQ